ncbi:MAG: recombinase family protein [Clostridia bacterium]
MARSTRKKPEILIEPVKETVCFSAAIYVRLSIENSGKSEDKDAISNQIEICKEYVAQNPELNLYDIYCDNGTSGTVFDRPDFNRLLNDIRSKKVTCLVVRDLSRFGRDYIETGTYIEQTFPKMGLRFISIKENYDSFCQGKNQDSLMIPLHNMINALYAKDISRKVSSAHKTRMSKPDFKKSTLAYGYKLDDTRENIIVDEEVAEYVKNMFSWRLEGVKLCEIVNRLNIQKAPNPQERKVQTGVRKGDLSQFSGWNRCTVRNILANPVYLGHTIVGKSEMALYKGRPQRSVVEQTQWTIFEDTHQALVSQEDFDRVQEIVKSQARETNSKREQNEKLRSEIFDMLEGKIFCADCGGKMYFKKEKRDGQYYGTYKCSSYMKNPRGKCRSHHCTQEQANKLILQAIKIQAKTAIGYEKLIKSQKNGKAHLVATKNVDISALSLKISAINKSKRKLYEDFSDGNLSEKDYLQSKKTYENQYEELSPLLQNEMAKQEKAKQDISAEKAWIKQMKAISRVRKLTKTMVDELIDSVRVCEDKSIVLKIKYEDIYLQILSRIKQMKTEEVA